MKKSSSILFVIPALMLIAGSAKALTVSIDTYGTTTLTRSVLGDEIDTKDQERLRTATPSPTSRVTLQQEKLIRVRNSEENENVELVDKRQPAQSQPEQFEAGSLNMTITAAQKDERLQKLEEARLRQEVKNQAVEQIRTERKERLQEQIKLHREESATQAGLFLTTRNMTARIPENQEIIVDPETNELGLLLPSGEIRAVNFLPDQAAARLQEHLDTALQTDGSGIELTTLEDGTVVYALPAQKTKHLFGFISRNVPTNYVLNDETGEVTEHPVTQTGIAQLFDWLSF